MSEAGRSQKRHWITAGKLGVSAGLIWAVASQLELHSFISHWRRLGPAIVLAVVGLVALQTTVIAGMRLKLLLEALGNRQRLLLTSQVELCGFFFEQVAFGFVGGDAMRLWLLHRLAIPLRDAFKALLVDRFLGFSALILLVGIGLPGLVDLVPTLQERISKLYIWALLLMLAAIAVAAVLLVPRRYWTHPVFAELGSLLTVSLSNSHVRVRFLLAFAFATFTHLLNVLIIFLIAHNLDLSVNLGQWFCIVPAALLFSMIPVSAGGWGLREGIFVVGLGALGIPAEEATVVSVLFGLGVLAATLPGGFVWLSRRRSGR